ncbi:MAG: hypothetical protein HOB82_05880 [Alphaproteobacteria bacterium]|jgi:adenylate cyclase|nr:hypothetical protein [Alphaproteobacteria bacterium]
MSSKDDPPKQAVPAGSEGQTGVSIQITIQSLFLLIVIPLALAIIFANFVLNQRASLEAAQVLLEEVDRTVTGEIARLFEPVITIAGTVAVTPAVTQSPTSDGHPALNMLLRSVEENRAVASEYIGFANGDFLLVIDLGEGYEATRASYDVPDTSRFVVEAYFTRSDGVRVSVATFLDSSRNLTASTRRENPGYDPRARPWYIAAEQSSGTVTTEPYMSSGPIGVGVTIARRTSGTTPAVFGADISVSSITTYLDELSESVGLSLQVIIFDGQTRVLAPTGLALAGQNTNDAEGTNFPILNQFSDPALRALGTRFLESGGNISDELLETDIGKYVLTVNQLPANFLNGDAYVAVLAPLNAFIAPIYRAGLWATVLSSIAVLLAIPVVILVARALSMPLRELAADANRVRNLEIDQAITGHSRIWEVRQLLEATNATKTALSAFVKYVPQDLVREVLSSGVSPEPGGDRRPVTVLFTDIKDFTTIAERMEPEELMEQLSTYFDQIVKRLLELNATVDKFVGDAVMAYWNAPILREDHVKLGCNAALACAQITNELNAKWEEAEAELFTTRFGVHSGYCIVGNVGSNKRLDYTVFWGRS